VGDRPYDQREAPCGSGLSQRYWPCFLAAAERLRSIIAQTLARRWAARLFPLVSRASLGQDPRRRYRLKMAVMRLPLLDADPYGLAAENCYAMLAILAAPAELQRC
jgi:hypothetical protein